VRLQAPGDGDLLMALAAHGAHRRQHIGVEIEPGVQTATQLHEVFTTGCRIVQCVRHHKAY
jgi:hypothetical protein